MRDDRLTALDLFIAKFLRYGVLLAGLIIFVGWMSQINFHRNVYADFAVYQNMPLLEELYFLVLQRNWGLIVSYVGLFVLISLPVIRVLLTAVVFVMERDFILAGCALLVLLGLVLSFSLGFHI